MFREGFIVNAFSLSKKKLTGGQTMTWDRKISRALVTVAVLFSVAGVPAGQAPDSTFRFARPAICTPSGLLSSVIA